MSQASIKITKFLKKNPRYSYNAPTLKKETGLKINTIRSELRRLHEKGVLHKETHGFYRIKLDAETLYCLENPPTLLHGIMVSMDLVQKLQKGIHGITSQKCNLEDNGFVFKSNKRFVKSFYFRDDVDRLVTITVHEKGRVDVYLNCSNRPVTFFEFREILVYVEAKIDFLGFFSNQRVVQFGMAKDFKEIRLEGASCLTLRIFMDNWFRVYNKERLGVTRVEQHVRCNVGVDTFVSLFERVFLPTVNGHREDSFDDVV